MSTPNNSTHGSTVTSLEIGAAYEFDGLLLVLEAIGADGLYVFRDPSHVPSPKSFRPAFRTFLKAAVAAGKPE